MEKSLCELLPLGRSLAILTKNYYGALTSKLAHLDIDRHFSILILIESLESGCSQQFICQQLNIDKVSMVRMIHYLIEKKYISKIVNKDDKREYLLHLTKKARTALPQIHRAIHELNQAVFKDLAAAKRKEFYNLLHTIQNNLDKLPADTIYINYKKSTIKK
jgi:DNA-binding MarR family transcriptional regulator